MHIILVSDRLATAKSLTLTGWHVFYFMSGLIVAVAVLASVLSYATLRYSGMNPSSLLRGLSQNESPQGGGNGEMSKSRAFVRESLDVMATKLGEMQAQLLRLDTLGARLAGMAGIKPQEIKAVERGTTEAGRPPADGRGGPLVNPSPLSEQELKQAIDVLSEQLALKADTLSLIEAQLLDERIKSNQLPTSLPIHADWNASTYGWRIDPFNGQRAMHEGVDFVAAPGTAITAAAAGVVVHAERHPDYGNYVELDHGNGLTTRYAHAAHLFVQIGQFVRRGQKIAAVGATGRATGPHLHFEVRLNDRAQNPIHFLQLAKNGETNSHSH